MVSYFSLILNTIEKKMKDIEEKTNKIEEKKKQRRSKQVEEKRNSALPEKNAEQLINKPKNIGTYENKIRGF